MSEPMTREELEAIRRRMTSYSERYPDIVGADKASLGFNVARTEKQLKADGYDDLFAEVAGHSISDVPRLLAEVDRLTEQVCKLEADLDEADQDSIKMTSALDAAERRAEAAVDDLNRDGTCDTCKRGPDNHKCGKCGVGCYEWRGPCAANSPEQGGEWKE